MCIVGKALHDTAPYAQSAHERWYNNASGALSFHTGKHVFLQIPISLPSFFLLLFSLRLSRHHFFFFFGFSVYLCARACIWHLSSGLRVMPWSCRKLGHCFMYAVRCPMLETPSLRMSVRATWNNATTGFSLLTHVYPKTNKLSFFPPSADWM